MTMLGVYVGNTPSDVTTFENWLGHPVDAVLGYTGRASWQDFEGSANWAAGLWSGTDRPILWSVPLIVDGTTLEQAATGAFNDHYLAAAKSIAATRPGDSEIYIRTGWEFNAQWFPWGAIGKEQDFIGAWKQFVDTFRSVDPRFKFDWCPNIGDMGMNPENAYPGDDYVDVIGLDFYHHPEWDKTDPNEAWDWMVNRTYGLQWHQDFAAAHGKPTSYAEWGINSDTAGPYIQHAADWFATHNVVYQTYWNSDADYAGALTTGHYPDAAAVFKATFSETAGTIPHTSGNDAMTGTDRGDLLDGGAGADSMSGGKGDDAYAVDNAGDVVTERADEGTDTVQSHVASYQLPSNVENLVLADKTGQIGIGNGLANHIVSGVGNDTLNGGAGDDTLTGGVGKDTFVAQRSTGHDTITDFATDSDVILLDGYAFTSFDTVKPLLETYGSDTALALPNGDVLLIKNVHPDQLTATNFAFASSLPPAPSWDPGPPPEAPTPWQYYRSGTGGNDNIAGNELNDYIDGSGGADTMAGGKGHDVYVVDQAGDVIVEKAGEGIDSVQSWAKSYVLPDNVEHITLLGNSDQSATGNALGNRIVGGGGGDTLNGGAGNDYIVGNAGNDTFVIQKGTGHDIIADFVAGSASTEKVVLDGYGFAGFDQVKAWMTGSGADTVLSLPNGDSLLFQNVTPGQFTADDFQFVGPAQSLPAAPSVPPSPLPTTPATGSTTTANVVVNVQGTEANGWNAHFNVLVDGQKIGEGTAATTAKDFAYTTNVTAGQPHAVQVQFDNDAWSATEDRNLIVNRVTVNGTAAGPTDASVTIDQGVLDGQDVTAGQSTLWSNGTLVVTADAGAFPGSAAPAAVVSTIVVNAASTANAHFKLLVDGQKVGEATTGATAKDFAFTTDLNTDHAHKVQVQFDNDGAVNGQDRNLFVNKLTINGHAVAPTDVGVSYDKGALDGKDMVAGQSSMWWNGTLVVNASADDFHSSTATPLDLWTHLVSQTTSTAHATAEAHPIQPAFEAVDLSGTLAGADPLHLHDGVHAAA